MVNNTNGLDVLARIEHLDELVTKERAVNHRPLTIERAGPGLVIDPRIHQCYLRDGQRTEPSGACQPSRGRFPAHLTDPWVPG